MSELLFHSQSPESAYSQLLLEITTQKAGWRFIDFSIRQIVPGDTWRDQTQDKEACIVLLYGSCMIKWDGGPEYHLGPREDVFKAYPHALYLPPDSRFQIWAEERTLLADGRAPARTTHPPRIVLPQDCGSEIRGGGNATRQIVDILPPDFPADRLMVCEVFTPSGNWSSYPPHKHDEDQPPDEVQLEEIYYFRFSHPEAYGFQRLYSADGSLDETLRVENGDLVLIRDGYHPFVTAYGYDAYYLNMLAGERRSMAASDDPRYAKFRRPWPAADPRLPMDFKPNMVESSPTKR